MTPRPACSNICLGAGRHKGRLGALLVEMQDGTTFSVGTGFSDAERGEAAVGGIASSLIATRKLSDGGVPPIPVLCRSSRRSRSSPVKEKGTSMK